MKKLIIPLLALLLALSVALVACDGGSNGEGKTDTSESATVEQTEAPTEEATQSPAATRQCIISVKLDNGALLAGVKFILSCDQNEYELVSGEDGTVSAELVVGTYTVSYDYDSLPSGCYPDTDAVEVGETASELLLTVIDNNPDGSAEKPFYVVDDITALSIDAGVEVHYVYRGMAIRSLVIENSGVSVFYKGAEYRAENGKVSVMLTPQMGEMIAFSIKNNTNARIDTEMSMVSPVGSMENPFALEAGSAEASVPAGGAVYYEYVANANGILVLSSTSELNNISLTNMNTYAVTSFTEGAAGAYMPVSKGDTVVIAVSSTDGENAAVIDLKVDCYVGSAEDPVPVIDSAIEISLPAGAAVSFFAETGKTVTLSNPSVTLTVGDQEYTPTETRYVLITLNGEGETASFTLTNNSDSAVSVLFEVK